MNPWFEFACRLVELHDQEGLDIELSLETAAEQKLPVPLIGLLCGAARHRMSVGFVRKTTEFWIKRFTPTEAEQMVASRLLE